MRWELDSINHTDLFTLCDGMDDQSVDMILCDLPYGTTACAWDTIIPFEPMWERFKRVIKPRSAIVLTASQPFTSALVMSNPKMFRYEWIWDKVNAATGLHAYMQPLKAHENVCVFSTEAHNYFPQMVKVPNRADKARLIPNGNAFSGKNTRRIYNNYGQGYPKSVITHSNANQAGKTHPTQKPVALFEYLIRTYTREGDLVIDPCVGSGTTAVAARNLRRRYICGDTSAEYVEIARQRIAAPYTPYMFTIDE